jgi:hypothetical protein
VFIKYKTLETRFGVFRKWHHKLKNVEVHKPEDLLSPDEITKLIAFCSQSGLDYGEIDVLRYRSDGRIYVVDVNNTPTINGHRVFLYGSKSNHISKSSYKLGIF